MIMYIFQPDRFLLDKQIREASKYISGRVLDIGAGEVDRYSHHFVAKEYVRMDIVSRDGVDIVGSADAIPLPDESFDAVVCTQVFEHLEHPDESAREIFRILKPGGYLLITAPQMNELHEEPYDFFRYTKYGLASLFESKGFKTIKLEQRGGFFSTLAQMRIRYMIDRFSLYRRPLVGKIFAPCCALYGKFALFLDSLDESVANRKHSIGWCIVLQK